MMEMNMGLQITLLLLSYVVGIATGILFMLYKDDKIIIQRYEHRKRFNWGIKWLNAVTYKYDKNPMKIFWIGYWVIGIKG